MTLAKTNRRMKGKIKFVVNTQEKMFINDEFRKCQVDNFPNFHF